MYRDGVDITQSPELRRAFGRFAACNILLIKPRCVHAQRGLQ